MKQNTVLLKKNIDYAPIFNTGQITNLKQTNKIETMQGTLIYIYYKTEASDFWWTSPQFYKSAFFFFLICKSDLFLSIKYICSPLLFIF